VTRFCGWASKAAAVLAKELRVELRTCYSLSALLLFAVTTLTVVSFAVGPYALDETLLAALLWIVVFFAAMTALARVFVREEETGTVTALRLAAEPEAVYAGKFLFNLLLLLLLLVTVVPLFVLFLNLSIPNIRLFGLVMGLGSIGLAAAATTVAAIIAKSGAKGPLFAVLSFPLLLPVLTVVIRATQAVLAGAAYAQVSGEIRLLFSYAGIVLTLSILLFDFIWNS